MTNDTPQACKYGSFRPSDYPAYRFEPDGTPVRIVPCTRGRYAGWAGPISSFISKLGHETFGLTRADGKQRGVSRATILRALGHSPTGAHETVAADPFEDPDGLFPRRQMLPSYPDYVADALGRVWRFQSGGRGRYLNPRPVTPVRPSGRVRADGTPGLAYYVLNSVAGTRDYVRVDKAAATAGFEPYDIEGATRLAVSLGLMDDV